MKFLFELHRSEEPEHQVKGLKCASYRAGGEMDATSIYGVRDKAIAFMIIPGVYSLQIRNAAEGCDWQDFGPVDTRNPEQAQQAAKKPRKTRTTRKATA